MFRALALSVAISLALAASALAGPIVPDTKVLYSEPVGAPGLTVAHAGGALYDLTFADLPIDMAVLAGALQPADGSIDWLVRIDTLRVDVSTRTLVGAMAVYDLVAGPYGLAVYDPLAAKDRMTANLVLGQLSVAVGGTFGSVGGQSVGPDLTGLAFDLANPDAASPVFDAFALESALDWGIAYSGLDLDAVLVGGLVGQYYAALSGHAQVLPEPASLALLGAGGVLLVVTRKM